jgi:hypothetical protein
VAILVESAEHGRELLRHLPDWAFHDAVPRKETLAVGQTDPAGRDMRFPAVMTSVVAHGMEIFANVLIRATGGYGVLRVKQVTSMAEDDSGRLVIDFADEFDPEAAADARRRRRAYQTDDRYRVIAETVTTTSSRNAKTDTTKPSTTAENRHDQTEYKRENRRNESE